MAQLTAQQCAILLRLVEQPEKWWKRRELPGTKAMREDLLNLAHSRHIETFTRQETLGNGRNVSVTLYRLAPPYRSKERIQREIGAW